LIEVEKLRKEYGAQIAVDGISFRAEAGTIYGLLGPNGAGKSTTIGCISGLHPPTGGNARVLGHDVVTQSRASRQALGVVPQELALYEELSARHNIDYWGGAYRLRGAALKQRVEEVLQLVGLADRAKEPCKNFSGGMKRRLNFACGIVHRPKVLLLDEPTVGVDPQSRVRLLDMVRDQANQGTCVLYTTHYMEEAESLCDRLGIIDGGKLIAEGSLEELRGMLGERDLLRLNGTFDPEKVGQALAADSDLADVEVVSIDANQLTLAAAQASARLSAVFSALTKAGSEIRETTLTRPSLESLFIKLTGKELRE